MRYVAILSGNINWIINIAECSYIYCVHGQLVYMIVLGYVFLKLFLDTSFFFTVID